MKNLGDYGTSITALNNFKPFKILGGGGGIVVDCGRGLNCSSTVAESG